MRLKREDYWKHLPRERRYVPVPFHRNKGFDVLTGLQFFIAPVSSIHFRGKDLEIPMSDGATGKYAAILKTYLTNIMYGREDHEWGVVVNERQFNA